MGAHRQRRGARPHGSPRAHNGRSRSHRRSQSKRIVGIVAVAIALVGLATAAISLKTAIITEHTARNNEGTARIQLEIALAHERAARVDEAIARHRLLKASQPRHRPRPGKHATDVLPISPP